MEDEEDLIERKTDSAKSRSPSIGESLYASTILSIEVCHLFTINIHQYIFSIVKEENKKRNRPLNDQQWVLQRKRIGLSRKSMKTLQASVESQKNKMTAISFIETHFNRKECIQFSPVSSSSPFCHCGQQKHSSRKEAETDSLDTMETIVEELDNDAFHQNSVPWHPATAIQVDPWVLVH